LVDLAGARRIIVEQNERLILVTPTAVWEKVRTAPRRLAMPGAAGRALSLTLKEPAVPLARLGLRLPETIERLRLEIRAPSGGPTDVEIRFEDRDEARAAEDLDQIAGELRGAALELNQVTALAGAFSSLLGLPHDLDIQVPALEFSRDGKSIVAK